MLSNQGEMGFLSPPLSRLIRPPSIAFCDHHDHGDGSSSGQDQDRTKGISASGMTTHPSERVTPPSPASPSSSAFVLFVNSSAMFHTYRTVFLSSFFLRFFSQLKEVNRHSWACAGGKGELELEQPMMDVVVTHIIPCREAIDEDVFRCINSLGCFKDREKLVQALLTPEHNTGETGMTGVWQKENLPFKSYEEARLSCLDSYRPIRAL